MSLKEPYSNYSKPIKPNLSKCINTQVSGLSTYSVTLVPLPAGQQHPTFFLSSCITRHSRSASNSCLVVFS